MLRTVPAILASLLLGAHWLRVGDLVLVGGCIALAVMVAIPRPAPRLLGRIALVGGSLLWLSTAWRIAQAREVAGVPYGRMLAILGGVAAFTLLAAWMLPAGRGPRKEDGDVY